MTAITIRLVVVLLAFGAVLCASAGAETRPTSNPGEGAGQVSPDQTSTDLARIRRLLGEPPAPGSEAVLSGFATMLKPEVRFIPQPVPADSRGIPRFKDEVEVIAFKGHALSFAEQLKALEEGSRFPYAYAPSLQELSARASDLQYLHPVNAILAARKAIGGALYRRKVEKTRRAVEAELQAINAHNAAVAAAGDSNPPKKRP